VGAPYFCVPRVIMLSFHKYEARNAHIDDYVHLDGSVSTLVSLEIFSQNVYCTWYRNPTNHVPQHGRCHGSFVTYETCILRECGVPFFPACQLSLFRVKISRCRRPTPKHASHVVKIVFHTRRRYTCLEMQIISLRI